MINRDLATLIKKDYSIKNPFPDLQVFKHQIDANTLHYKPFTIHKKKINLYRWIFLGLGIFYMLCAGLFFYKLSAYTTNFLIGSYSFLIKNTACVLCIIASLICISVSYFLSAEKEAAHFSYKKARRKLRDIYLHNVSKIGFKRFISYGEGRQNLINFKQIYHDSLDRLHHYKDDTVALIERIMLSESLDPTKRELLLNHSLLEMDEKMMDVIQKFKSPDNLKLLSHSSLL